MEVFQKRFAYCKTILTNTIKNFNIYLVICTCPWKEKYLSISFVRYSMFSALGIHVWGKHDILAKIYVSDNWLLEFWDFLLLILETALELHALLQDHGEELKALFNSLEKDIKGLYSLGRVGQALELLVLLIIFLGIEFFTNTLKDILLTLLESDGDCIEMIVAVVQFVF